MITLADSPILILALIGFKTIVFGPAPILRKYRCPTCNGSGTHNNRGDSK